MARGILWCPHCGRPHDLEATICPTTGKSLERGIHKERRERPHPLVGKLIAGRYRVTRVIGIGGMGEVLEAENAALRRLVAIKVVRPKHTSDDAIERLRREAHLVAAVQHPNICDVLDVGTMEDGRPYVVLERLFGESLSKHLKNVRQLDLNWARELFTQMLSGLHAAHGANIVHRDLKPQNVFLVDRVGCAPLVKLVDFGFAKDISGMRGGTMTRPGKAVGTPGYMAPEQLSGERVDRRADLFAVGVMMHEALAGSHPFSRQTEMEMQAAILREEPRTIAASRRDVPPAVEVVVHRALAKKRDDRWATALDLQQAFLRAFR